MTNYEYIKSLSVKRMAQFIVTEMSTSPCDYCKYDHLSCGKKCGGRIIEDIVEEWLKREKDKCI